MDLKNWERIAKDLKNVEYFYHVIIGIDAYRIWQYDKDGKDCSNQHVLLEGA